MDEREKLNAVRLILTPQIGPITHSLLLARYGTATQAVIEAPQLAPRRGRTLKIVSKAIAQAIFDDAQKAGATLIIRGQDEYPKRLLLFDDAPVMLFAKGHLSLLKREKIAIVGARNASTNARNLTAHWAEALAKEQFAIVSGLARGIDRAAHIGSLAYGTIGVIGCGIDSIYPPENEDLFEQMAQTGLILTEFIPGTKPSPRNFPARNRIIASLVTGTIIIEAAIRSGSLITAKEALERGAEVMAVPGSPLDQRAHGTNQLIKDGAHLVSSPQDVLDIMRAIISEPPPQRPPFHSHISSDVDDEMIRNLADEIMKILTFEPTDIDELTRQCHVSAKVTQIALLELELAGHVERLSSNRVCKLITFE